MILVSELIQKLTTLMEKHGNLPVLVALDEGNFDIESPVFDTDKAGDDCYLI